MSRTYQDAAPDSRKRRNRPLFEYSMPLTKEEWKHLLHWVVRNDTGLTKQLLKENDNENK